MEVAEKKRKMKQLFFPHTKKVPNNMIIIPNDVIIEILSWLPAKSLLRLRWTCKYWFDLISNRDVHADSFIKMHLHHHHSTTIISRPFDSSIFSFCFMTDFNRYGCRFLSQGYYINYNDDSNHHHHVSRSSEVIGIHHPSVKHQEYIHVILGSCNGLILLKLSNKFVHESHLCILNPFTKEYRLLRRPPYSLLGGTYGFGYGETIDDYKIIRILDYTMHMNDVNLSQYSVVEVYTLSEDSWRWISPCPYQLSPLSHGVFMNGALYWMDFRNENVISFDIGKEEFQHVVKTPNLIGRPQRYELQVFEGSLCLVILLLNINHDQKNSQFVEIWVMKNHTVNNNNNNESSLLWTKLLTIPGLQWFPIKLVGYTRNGEILILKNHKDLVLYDPNNTRDPTTLQWILENRYPSSTLEVYTESLVPLNSGTYARQETRIEANLEL